MVRFGYDERLERFGAAPFLFGPAPSKGGVVTTNTILRDNRIMRDTLRMTDNA